MKKLNERSYHMMLPYDEEIVIDMSDCIDNNNIIKLADYLEKGLKKEPETSDLDIKVKANKDVVAISLSGQFDISYTPGTMATWNDPGDPDDFEGLPENDFALSLVRYLIKKYPEDIVFKKEKHLKDKSFQEKFLENCVRSEDGGVPSEDYILDILDANSNDINYEKFESVLKSVLNGKTLSEALKEGYEWDRQSDEFILDDYIAAQEFNSESNKWRNEAIVKINKFASATRELKEVLDQGKIYGIDFSQADSKYPFKVNKDKIDKAVNDYTYQLHNIVVKGN